MNVGALAALRRRRQVFYAGPIDPPASWARKASSKAMRLAGGRGKFHFFSASRLRAVAAAVAERDAPGAKLDFFHGFTPWTATRPTRPYVAWSDCTFREYVRIFHDVTKFQADDIARIERAEARWLKGARRVLFTSDWAAGEAIRGYGLDSSRTRSVGIFGEIEAPEADSYAGAARFVFMSTNFAAKGGPVATEAVRHLRRTHPNAELIVVGSLPRSPIAQDGIEYVGFLSKEVAEDVRRLRTMVASSAAIVLPTSSDICPLSLVEAAAFGCPAIASRAFAIPEIIGNGGGILLDNPTDPKEVAAAMGWMLDNPGAHADMRREAWRAARERHSRAAFEARLLAEVDEALAEPSPDTREGPVSAVRFARR
ncbi:MAG: glycosyltransferase [Caulobacteraceae bacterium]